MKTIFEYSPEEKRIYLTGYTRATIEAVDRLYKHADAIQKLIDTLEAQKETLVSVFNGDTK